jgi:hypothetical protein
MKIFTYFRRTMIIVVMAVYLLGATGNAAVSAEKVDLILETTKQNYLEYKCFIFKVEDKRFSFLPNVRDISIDGWFTDGEFMKGRETYIRKNEHGQDEQVNEDLQKPCSMFMGLLAKQDHRIMRIFIERYYLKIWLKPDSLTGELPEYEAVSGDIAIEVREIMQTRATDGWVIHLVMPTS